MMRNLFNFFNYSTAEQKSSDQRGQGYTEYAIIISLVAIAIIAIIGVMSPAISDTFKRLIDANAVAPPSIAGYTPPAPTSVNPTDIPDTYLLTVNSINDGTGSGSTSPSGQTSQPSSQNVSIQANANAGAEFIGWDGDASGVVNPVLVMMDGDKTVTARFRVKCYDLVDVAIGAGDILKSPEPNCPHNGGDYQDGTTVELRAIHAPDITFYSWTGDITPTSDETINVTVDQDLHIEATFEVVCYTLIVNSPDGHGNVVRSPEPLCLTDNTRYTHGKEVTLIPQPIQGYEFDHWGNGDLDNTTNPGIIIMDGDKEINAYYRERCYAVNAIASGNGSVNITNPASPNCSNGTGYRLNTDVTFEAVPSIDDFLYWSGHASGENPIVTVTIIGDTTVNAVFGSCYPLTTSVNGQGNVIVNTDPTCENGDPGWYQRGTVVEIIANPDPEYDILNWSGDASGTNQTLNLTMNAVQNVIANFEACYTLTATSNGNGSVTDSGDVCSTNSNKYKPQSLATLTASPDTSYQFDSWSGDLVSSDNPANITMSGNQTVAANFVPCDGPPSPWSNRDIGSVATAGDTCYNNGTFTVNGSGNNINNSADEFQYAYQPFNGDGYITARIVSQQDTHGYARAGIMIREDMGAGSRNTFVSVTPDYDLRFQRRTAVNETTNSIGGGNYHAPTWLKLERQGNTFTAFRSIDGINWTLFGTRDVTMGAIVSIGLAVSSHNDGILSEAVFDNVEIQTTSQVAITFAGEGIGSVNITPPNTDCTADCVESVDDGTAVTITPTAGPGYVFAGWSGDAACGTGVNPLSLTVNSNLNCTATFTLDCDPLPALWSNADIGAVGAVGNTCYQNGDFIVDGAGERIWDPSDEFQYAYRSFTGDGYIIARIASQENTNNSAKAGVMFRESLNSNSQYAFTALRLSNGTRLQWDTGSSNVVNYGGDTAPVWVRLERLGDTFTGSRSDDGVNWTEISSHNVVMGATVYVGLAVSAYDDAVLSRTIFDNVEIGVPTVPHQMTVEFAGTGSGTVNLNLPSVDCTANCIEMYNHGNSIGLTATPDYNSTFAGWSGDTGCGSSGTIVSDMTCIATFNRVNSTQTYEESVSNGSDDSEEYVYNGNNYAGSSDLEMVMENVEQIVGVRFRNVTIPAGAIVTNAYIVFATDETNSRDTSLTIRGQDIGDAPTFTSANSDISSRTTTTAVADWRNIPEWDAVGVTHQTANLKNIVQEIIDRGDWASGNNIAFIISGSGKRVASSVNGSTAPVLHIEYEFGLCTTYNSTDVPKAISSSGTPSISSVLNIASSGTILDVNVLNLSGQHTWISDLDINLISPQGTAVQIANFNTCGSEDDFNLNLDDEGSGTWSCPPTGGGTYLPTNALSAFDGQDSAGNWTLRINDIYNNDGGSLDSWSLEICVQ